jgi:hypothetical protein
MLCGCFGLEGPIGLTAIDVQAPNARLSKMAASALKQLQAISIQH